MDISASFVVQWWVVVGALVAPDESPGGPIKSELILGGAETQPIKLHVGRFGLTRHNYVVSEAGGGGFVSLKGGRWLWSTYFNECLVLGNHCLQDDKHGSYFGFSGRLHDELDNPGDGENGAIVSRHRFVFRE